MAECPFCAAEIDENLVNYGGPCPKCFAEIPGEEAPTDPGAEARAVQERRDRRGATIKAFLGLAAMAAMVSCTGLAALVVVLWPEPEVAVLDFDGAEFDYPEFELVGTELAAEGGAEADPVDAGTAKSGGGAPRPAVDPSRYAQKAPVEGGAVDAADALKGSTDGVAEADAPRPRGGTEGPAGPAAIEVPSTEQQRSDLGANPLDFQVARRAEMITDPELIRAMIGKLMAAQVRKLNYCYEKRLNDDPDLAGRWLIQYTVTTEGRAADVTVTAKDAPDAEFESCMAANIAEKWRFDPIVRDQPVQRTLTFRPG